MKNLFTVLFILIATCGYAQIAYYDALEIHRQFSGDVFPTDSGKANTAFKLLELYMKKDAATTSVTKEEILMAYANNPFIGPLMPEGTPSSQSNFAATKVGSILGKVSGLDVTNYADALAQFMVERAREELDVAFFQKFRNFLEKNPEVGILFPETSDFLANMLAHEYSQLLSGLRDAFHEDLRNLLNNLDDVFLLPKFQQVVNEFPEILVVIRSIQIVADLGENEHPADIIRDFRDMDEWNKVKRPEVKNLHNFIKTTALVSDAVRFKAGDIELISLPEGLIRQSNTLLTATTLSTTRIIKEWSDDRNWITARHFEMLFKDSLATQMFLGLVYQKAATDDIKFTINGTEKKLTDVMANNKVSIFLFRSYFLEFLRLAEQTEEKLAELKSKKKGNVEITPQEYFEYISAGIDVIEYGFKVANLVDNRFKGEEYITIMRTGNNLYRNIVEKNYGAAVTNALKIIEWLTETITEGEGFENAKAKALAAQLKLLPADADAKRKDEVKAAVENSFAAFEGLNKLSRGALKYGVFMANVVDAKSPEDIKQAIRNSTLPVGSSSYKKYQQFTLSINSYLGAQLRLEQKNSPKRTWDQNFGIIAPIGLALNHGLGKGGSLSVFAPLLDVGAIAEFRLNDSGTQLTESIKLGNLFSPGTYLVYGFPGNIPLAFGIGGQHGPGLYKVNTSPTGTANSYGNPSWRWNIFLTVDMPLFNLTPGKKLRAK